MSKSKSLQPLPLSNLLLDDKHIDDELANQLVVWSYYLDTSNRIWKERNPREYIDTILGHQHYAYVMKGSTIFVAVPDESHTPPTIVNIDGTELRQTRVYYAPIHNPIWIRLIFRSISAFNSHCKGSYRLGEQLIPIKTWDKGITALRIDCRSDKVKISDLVELSFFHNFVPLRAKKESEILKGNRQSLWSFEKNKKLVRWRQSDKVKADGTLFMEIKKNNSIKNSLPFLDTTNQETFSTSWPMIIKPIQDDFIKHAAHYGFYLKPLVLQLERAKVRTRRSDRKKEYPFKDLDVSGTLKVLDLRCNTKVSTEQVLEIFNKLLIDKSVTINWELIRDFQLDNLNALQLNNTDRVLVILDQIKGVEGDRYPLTKPLKKKCAVQHISINPYDNSQLDPIEMGLLIEVEDGPKDIFYCLADETKQYYAYDFQDLNSNEVYKESIKLKIEVVTKELKLKLFLRDINQLVSETLGIQAKHLTSSLIVIYDGYLFTVENDRPVFLPFDPTDKGLSKEADKYLSKLGTSYTELLTKTFTEWPYNYPSPEDLQQERSNKPESFKKRINKLIYLISKADDGEVSILMQTTNYQRRFILPSGLEAVTSELANKKTAYSLRDWKINDIDKFERIANNVAQKKYSTSVNQISQALLSTLPELIQCWHLSLNQLAKENKMSVSYEEIKNVLNKHWHNKFKKNLDKTYINNIDTLFSQYFGRLLNDIRHWVRGIPGIKDIWFDKKLGYFVVGGLDAPKYKTNYQPSLRQWHVLQGSLDTDLIIDLLDVDWVRMNQFAGYPYPITLIKRWKEIHDLDEG